VRGNGRKPFLLTQNAFGQKSMAGDCAAAAFVGAFTISPLAVQCRRQAVSCVKTPSLLLLPHIINASRFFVKGLPRADYYYSLQL